MISDGNNQDTATTVYTNNAPDEVNAGARQSVVSYCNADGVASCSAAGIAAHLKAKGVLIVGVYTRHSTVWVP